MKAAKFALLLTIVSVMAALALFALPAIGQSGDYGIYTGNGCGQTHYCTPTPEGAYTPEPTSTMSGPSVSVGP